MWNMISSNKLLEQRIRQKNYSNHISKLNAMKPVIRIKEPEQPQFIFTKPKTEMLRRDKLIQIDRQNLILTNKMINVQNQIYLDCKLKFQSQQLKTLNQVALNQQQVQIQNDNEKICNRLLRVNSHYPTFKFLQDSQKIEKVKLNISQNARRAMSVRSFKSRPSSAQSHSKFYRSRVSRYDNAGNGVKSKINILYKLNNEERRRPFSATHKKSSFIPSTIAKQLDRHEKEQAEVSKQFISNILTQQYTSPS